MRLCKNPKSFINICVHMLIAVVHDLRGLTKFMPYDSGAFYSDNRQLCLQRFCYRF